MTKNQTEIDFLPSDADANGSAGNGTMKKDRPSPNFVQSPIKRSKLGIVQSQSMHSEVCFSN